MQIDLPRQIVDQLLAGLLGLGLIVVTGQYGERVFRAANSRAARFCGNESLGNRQGFSDRQTWPRFWNFFRKELLFPDGEAEA